MTTRRHQQLGSDVQHDLPQSPKVLIKRVIKTHTPKTPREGLPKSSALTARKFGECENSGGRDENSGVDGVVKERVEDVSSSRTVPKSPPFRIDVYTRLLFSIIIAALSMVILSIYLSVKHLSVVESVIQELYLKSEAATNQITNWLSET
uniref:Uncharacterized protein n=1 Tax=Spongospora subterranea TaxID=70186 RepID=A0A0H5RCU3_9EUKA|eukprot:CRZ11576.1 hypothetical protein [Spongospora subterranea]